MVSLFLRNDLPFTCRENNVEDGVVLNCLFVGLRFYNDFSNNLNSACVYI